MQFLTVTRAIISYCNCTQMCVQSLVFLFLNFEIYFSQDPKRPILRFSFKVECYCTRKPDNQSMLRASSLPVAILTQTEYTSHGTIEFTVAMQAVTIVIAIAILHYLQIT